MPMSESRPEDLTPPEILLLVSAARLLAAVEWLTKNPPPADEWEMLNKKVKEEIVSIYNCAWAYN